MGSLLPGLWIAAAMMVMRAAPGLPLWADMLVTACALVVMGLAFVAAYKRSTTQQGPNP